MKVDTGRTARSSIGISSINCPKFWRGSKQRTITINWHLFSTITRRTWATLAQQLPNLKTLNGNKPRNKSLLSQGSTTKSSSHAIPTWVKSSIIGVLETVRLCAQRSKFARLLTTTVRKLRSIVRVETKWSIRRSLFPCWTRSRSWCLTNSRKILSDRSTGNLKWVSA